MAACFCSRRAAASSRALGVASAAARRHTSSGVASMASATAASGVQARQGARVCGRARIRSSGSEGGKGEVKGEREP
eukprot:7828576-Pyramimonas_sp.AAC.1